jgi:hypothetical protein
MQTVKIPLSPRGIFRYPNSDKCDFFAFSHLLNSSRSPIMKRTIKLLSIDQVIRLPFDFCIRCGQKNRVEFQFFEQKESNPVAEFAKLAGDVSVVAEYLLNKPHKVEAPFCNDCFRGFNLLPSKKLLFHLIFLVIILISIFASMYVNSIAGIAYSVAVFGLGICCGICVNIYSRYYSWKNSPKIKKIDKKKLILKVPGQGKLICHR